VLRDIEELSTEKPPKHWEFGAGSEIAASASAAKITGKTEPIFSAGCRKLNCETVIRELSNYLDGDLSVSVKLELEQHLKFARIAHW